MKGKDWPQQGKPWRTLPGADISPTKLASKASRNLALEYTACESLEQQQDSGPSHAKPPPQKLSKRRLRNPLKRKMKGKDWLQQGTPLRKPLRTLPGADISPTKLASKASRPRSTACESLEQQQDSGPSHAKPPPQKLSKRRLRNLWKRKKNEWKEKIGPSKENLGARFQEPTYRLQSLPQKRLEIWPWSTACESLEQQQDSGPSHAKPPPQKLSKRRLRNPLKRKKNERKRLAPARKTFAHASRGRHIAYTKLASKSSRNLALEYRLRKPRKAARFGPKPCETATTKTLETSLTKPIKKKEKWKEKIGPSKENLGARFQEPTYRLQSLPQKRLEIWPWSTACESLEQQQDSGPSHAKPPPQKLSKRRLRNPLKRKMKRKDWLQQGTPLRKPLRTLPGADISPTKLASKASRPRSTACESLEQQQDSGPSHAKPPPQKLSKRRLRNLWERKKNEWKEKIGPSKENLGARFQEPTYRLQSLPQKRLEIWPWSTACESLEQQQDSGPERKMKGKDWLQQGKPLRTLLGADISPIQSLPQNRLEIWP